MKELHRMAAVVHGFLVFGHALGLAYNVRRCADDDGPIWHRRHLVDVAAHAFGLGYSLRASVHHVRWTSP